MPFRQRVCNICLQTHENLKHTDENAEDNIKFITKLSSCIPELDWSKGHLMCDGCIYKLNTVYDFRKLCFQAFELLSETEDSGLKYESDCTLNNLPDLSDEDVNKYTVVKNEINFNNTNRNKENLDRKLLPVEIQKSLCNSLLNKKFKTNRLHDVNRKLLLQQESDIKLEDKSEVKLINTQVICFHCDKSFCDKDILITHLSTEHTSDDTKPYNCNNDMCQEERLKSKPKEFKCLKCLRIFTTEKVLKIHLLNCNGVLKPKQTDPEENEKDLNTGRPYIQGEISNKKDNEGDIKVKAKRGRKPLEKQIYQCNICSVIFSTKYLLNRHVRNVHAAEKLHKCDICSQKFASPVYLSAHKRYHSGERPHICSSCGKGFITASDLYHHEKIHANKRSYKCDKCPKAFNTSSDLHKHNICVHVDRSEWKYVCSFCNKRFPLKTNMDTHVKIHTGEKNFACHLCDRRCINKSVLLRHIETHSNVRSFRCSVCNQEYKYQKSLDIHMTKAHGIGNAKIPERVKKYICHVCPKSYYANNKLQKHIRTHTGERPFMCNVCEKKFIDKSSLNQHMKTSHSILFGILNN